MKKFFYIFFLILLFFFSSPLPTLAYTDPLSTPNNRFGIHVLDENDFSAAAQLVNSNGGEWGYVTFVIREDERDPARWNRAFENLAELKLIPIVRLATVSQNGVWQIPSPQEARPWAQFLDSLPWPTQNHYVILFNEPNHAKEWGNSLDPAEYATVTRRYWEQLKRYSPDFFVLPAGFDAAAPDSNSTMSIENYFAQMFESDELIFTIFDGWNSHSYPNPAFCGSPADQGKTSIQSFIWETNYLEKYYLRPSLPIFITETGWACPAADLPNFYTQAFTQIWNNPRLVTITPFILSYQSAPFQAFSWLDPSAKPLAHYQVIQALAKIAGKPIL